MGNKLKEIDTKNCTYYFLDDMINTKNLDPYKIKIDENSDKALLIVALYSCTLCTLKKEMEMII